jgi:hypothetical protein
MSSIGENIENDERSAPIGAIVPMNKQKNRYTPFDGAYRMPVNIFCRKYGLDLQTIMHRMNVLFWEDFDTLVVPVELGDITPRMIRIILKDLKNGISHQCICNSMNKRFTVRVTLEDIDFIANMDDYMKSIFLEMDNFMYLNPDKIDITKIFTEVNDEYAEEKEVS